MYIICTAAAAPEPHQRGGPQPQLHPAGHHGQSGGSVDQAQVCVSCEYEGLIK